VEQKEYWWQSENIGRDAWCTAIALASAQEWRKLQFVTMLNLFEQRPNGVLFDDSEDELKYNLSRAAVDTVHAEIAGRQKPVPKFQTQGADWKTKRKAKAMEKFILGFLAQPQGDFLNAHELMEDAFIDAMVGGTSVVKVLSNATEKKVKLERHLAHELFVDPMEARYGRVRSLFHVYYMDKSVAIEQFADGEDADEILMAIESSAPEKFDDVSDPDGSVRRAGYQIKVVEAWRVSSNGKPGCHVFCINGVLVYEEEWDRPDFPFVITRWEKERLGYWGIGLVEQGKSIQNELNDNAAKLQERFRLCGAKRTYYVKGSLAPEFLQENEAETFIPINKGYDIPKESTPSPIADAEAQWLDSQYQKFFEITGVSQMRASARKEPGVTAGVAIRTLNDMQSARFALRGRAYENSYIKLTYLVIQELRALQAANVDISVGKGKKINWADSCVPEEMYDISVAPVSSLPNDPAGRMQMIDELFQRQLISPETFKQLLGWPDLEKEMNSQTAQSDYLGMVFDRMLDGEAYESPDGHIIDKQRALIQASNVYFEALYNDAPEDVVGNIAKYIREISVMIEKITQEIATKAMRQQQAMMDAEENMMNRPPDKPGMVAQ